MGLDDAGFEVLGLDAGLDTLGFDTLGFDVVGLDAWGLAAAGFAGRSELFETTAGPVAFAGWAACRAVVRVFRSDVPSVLVAVRFGLVAVRFGLVAVRFGLVAVRFGPGAAHAGVRACRGAAAGTAVKVFGSKSTVADIGADKAAPLGELCSVPSRPAEVTASAVVAAASAEVAG